MFLFINHIFECSHSISTYTSEMCSSIDDLMKSNTTCLSNNSTHLKFSRSEVREFLKKKKMRNKIIHHL